MGESRPTGCETSFERFHIESGGATAVLLIGTQKPDGLCVKTISIEDIQVKVKWVEKKNSTIDSPVLAGGSDSVEPWGSYLN